VVVYRNVGHQFALDTGRELPHVDVRDDHGGGVRSRDSANGVPHKTLDTRKLLIKGPLRRAFFIWQLLRSITQAQQLVGLLILFLPLLVLY
jgi:hypothetical protein